MVEMLTPPWGKHFCKAMFRGMGEFMD